MYAYGPSGPLFERKQSGSEFREGRSARARAHVRVRGVDARPALEAGTNHQVARGIRCQCCPGQDTAAVALGRRGVGCWPVESSAVGCLPPPHRRASTHSRAADAARPPRHLPFIQEAPTWKRSYVNAQKLVYIICRNPPAIVSVQPLIALAQITPRSKHCCDLLRPSRPLLRPKQRPI